MGDLWSVTFVWLLTNSIKIATWILYINIKTYTVSKLTLFCSRTLMCYDGNCPVILIIIFNGAVQKIFKNQHSYFKKSNQCSYVPLAAGTCKLTGW